jgi:hypothetical protein
MTDPNMMQGSGGMDASAWGGQNTAGGQSGMMEAMKDPKVMQMVADMLRKQGIDPQQAMGAMQQQQPSGGAWGGIAQGLQGIQGSQLPQQFGNMMGK